MGVQSWQRHASALSGFAVEYGWATGELLMIPYLTTRLGLGLELAGLIYVVNPVVGLACQPILGHASDTCGERRRQTFRLGWLRNRRLPFILALSVLAAVNMLILAYSSTGAAWVADDPEAQRVAELWICFVSFGLMDVAHDAILVPGRALVVDLYAHGTTRLDEDEADALYTNSALCGKFTAMVVGALCGGTSADERQLLDGFRTLLLISLCVLVACTLGTLAGGLALDERPGLGSASRAAKTCADDAAESGSGHDTEMELLGEEITTLLPEPLSADLERSASGIAGGGGSSSRWRLVVILAVQHNGWLLIGLQAFWWSQWIGLATRVPGTETLGLAFSSFALQTLGAIVWCWKLPSLSARFSARALWVVGEGMLACLMLGTPLLDVRAEGSGVMLLVLAATLASFGIATHTNLIYTLVRELADDKDALGFWIACCNSSMIASQLVVGFGAGYLIREANSVSTVFAGAALVVGLLNTALLSLDAALESRG